MNTLPEMLAEVAEANASRPAVVQGGRVLTYAGLLRAAQAGAADLARRGVRPGQRVALLLPNSLDYVVAYFAASTAGAVVAPLNHHYQQSELRYFLDECDVRLLVAAHEFRGLCETVVPQSKRPAPVLWAEAWVADLLAARVAPPRVAITSGDPVMHQFSSGSTGHPKRIARTHANLLFELDSLAQTLGLTTADRFLGVAPFSHVNGLTRSMLACLRVGGALYPAAQFDRHAVAALIERERLSVFIAVPFMFSALAQSNFRRPPDFASLRLCASASAPMPANLNRLFNEKFGRYVRQLYGSTETGTISVNLRPDIENSLDSVGTPIAGVHVAVFGDDGQPAPAGALGEFAVSSPAAITGYDNLPEVNRQAFRGGYFLTGDLGRRDADGMLTLAGRKKFLINKSGFKIDPREVEALLETHPRVLEAVVLGVPSPYGDERVKAVIVPVGPCTEAEIVAHCRGQIADFKIPSLIEFRASLPKTATGKVRRALLV
jgi:long-chain acyl-CoA synthetase